MPPAQESKAQAEFARYKQRIEASGPAAPFASPLPVGAIPAWSLQPAFAAAEPQGAAGSSTTTSVVQGLGTTIRLGVDVLNAALANSVAMLGGAARAWSSTSCGCACGWSCDDCCDCCDCCGYDCCCVMSCACGCCEPRVGACC
jgi:hypothetical protein